MLRQGMGKGGSLKFPDMSVLFCFITSFVLFYFFPYNGGEGLLKIRERNTQRHLKESKVEMTSRLSWVM